MPHSSTTVVDKVYLTPKEEPLSNICTDSPMLLDSHCSRGEYEDHGTAKVPSFFEQPTKSGTRTKGYPCLESAGFRAGHLVVAPDKCCSGKEGMV